MVVGLGWRHSLDWRQRQNRPWGDTHGEADAKRTVAAILRVHPEFSIKKYVARLSYRDPAELTRFEDGLRKAGLPE